ncbi:SH3 domain-containing protein [Brotaphodocola sp.]|uniref:SH3 domain-containing protein n=1 Tax=Brotaphodocola sp. TaxID=3073577 RepID=UPI003D7C4FBE
MGTNSNINWEKIQQGVNEVERLIGQKEYNSAMITARQTLELMVRLQMERADIVTGSSDLMSMIDCLYKNRWISKATCERYHKIRMIGNKAVHDGDNNAYSANQAYHELSQEVYTFANDYRNAQKGVRPAPARQPAARQNKPARGSAPDSSGRSRKQKGITFTTADLLKLLIPVICIALLFVIIKIVRPNSDTGKKKTTAAVTTEAVTSSDSSDEANTAETEPEIIYRTTSNLNVRSRPSTDGDKLGQLSAGSAIEYIGDSDDGAWAKINYNGQEGYVSKEFLTTE